MGSRIMVKASVTVDDEIHFLGEIQSMALQPDDIVVVSTQARLSTDAHASIKRMAQEVFHGHKVVVIDDGLRLGVMSPTGDRITAIEELLQTVVASLGVLLQALADDGEPAEPERTLDGVQQGGERDQGVSLG